jgi:hypothetical protein
MLEKLSADSFTCAPVPVHHGICAVLYCARAGQFLADAAESAELPILALIMV